MKSSNASDNQLIEINHKIQSFILEIMPKNFRLGVSAYLLKDYNSILSKPISALDFFKRGGSNHQFYLEGCNTDEWITDVELNSKTVEYIPFCMPDTRSSIISYHSLVYPLILKRLNEQEQQAYIAYVSPCDWFGCAKAVSFDQNLLKKHFNFSYFPKKPSITSIHSYLELLEKIEEPDINFFIQAIKRISISLKKTKNSFLLKDFLDKKLPHALHHFDDYLEKTKPQSGFIESIHNDIICITLDKRKIEAMMALKDSNEKYQHEQYYTLGLSHVCDFLKSYRNADTNIENIIFSGIQPSIQYFKMFIERTNHDVPVLMDTDMIEDLIKNYFIEIDNDDNLKLIVDTYILKKMVKHINSADDSVRQKLHKI